ncbi:hypothetical protein BDV29DRAFT_123196 [Aspergillus leporis]|uniref:Uncharacterized protein n=1 Tax=Aspergillus leporis TaxID=41062 RepID=A0A5N5X526_9EURO|nr:hypothetical protein BDV29DRAFT_123196 [Aspergillus leporis]
MRVFGNVAKKGNSCLCFNYSVPSFNQSLPMTLLCYCTPRSPTTYKVPEQSNIPQGIVDFSTQFC